ncbi:MAG: NUDIX domain-containing protein, partial [Myxococcales bacterium]|nr:NUDIX domain-containing protein [Myxococcales bacterium]
MAGFDPKPPGLKGNRLVVRQAAVALCLKAEPELSILFIRRAQSPTDPWSGHMAFPGGRVEPDDRGPLGAAMRETK